MKQRIVTIPAGAALVALIGMAVMPGSALGSVARALTLGQQVALSDLVVEGHVGLNVQSMDPTTGRPMMDTAIHIVEILRGSADGSVLNIRQLRGDVGGQWVSVAGDPVLRTGDHVILMLRHVDGRYYLTALSQSVFWVDDRATPPRIEQRFAGLTRVTEAGGGRVLAADAPVSTLDELRVELRAAIRRAEVGQ